MLGLIWFLFIAGYDGSTHVMQFATFETCEEVRQAVVGARWRICLDP